MVNSKRINIAAFAIIFLSGLAFVIAGSLADLKASDALYDGHDSFVNILGEVLGEVPAYLMVAFCAVLLFIGAKRSGVRGKNLPFKILSVLLILFFLAGAVVSLMMLFSYAAKYLVGDGSTAYLLALLIGVLMTGAMLFMFKNISDEKLKLLKKWCVTTVISIAALFLVVKILKVTWGRVRYFEMAEANDFSAFTAWFLPQGVTGHESFPSGHTASAVCALYLIPLAGTVSDVQNKNRWQFLAASGAVVFALVMAFFRVIGGNHYLSDAGFAMLLSGLAFGAGSAIAYGKTFEDYLMRGKNVEEL